jgi:type IV pilus assembly protein PilB
VVSSWSLEKDVYAIIITCRGISSVQRNGSSWSLEREVRAGRVASVSANFGWICWCSGILGVRLSCNLMEMMLMSALKRFSNTDQLNMQRGLDPETTNMVPDQIVRRCGMVLLDDLDLEPVEVAGKDIEALITRYFELPEVKKAILEVDEVVGEGSAADSPIIQLVNTIILKAVHEGASDIHIEPFKDQVLVRFRVDGVLHRRYKLPCRIIFPLVSRLKVMANLDITERRLPQDGRIPLDLSSCDLDLRISTVPTIFGEKVVIRIFDKGSIKNYTLENLDFSPTNYKMMQGFLNSTSGLLLVTGPTGSGKTTTLYTALEKISSVEKNIVTVEDPVEYVLEGVNQTQINSKAGATFATYLRSILRQDPDVIMIGEIRDLETAEIAVRAASTGHLVLSTMHTSDAPGALMRLVDMGVEPFMVASSVLGVVSQRLVRRVCTHCQESGQMSELELSLVGVVGDEKNVRFSQGCSKCAYTGYRGRSAIHEVLKVSGTLQKLILQRASVSELRSAALDDEMISIKEDGIWKAARGITTIQELMRVTGEEEILTKARKALVRR